MLHLARCRSNEILKHRKIILLYFGSFDQIYKIVTEESKFQVNQKKVEYTSNNFVSEINDILRTHLLQINYVY